MPFANGRFTRYTESSPAAPGKEEGRYGNFISRG